MRHLFIIAGVFLFALDFTQSGFTADRPTLRELAHQYNCALLFEKSGRERSSSQVEEIRRRLDPDSGIGWVEVNVQDLFPEGFLDRVKEKLLNDLRELLKRYPSRWQGAFTLTEASSRLESLIGKTDVGTMLNYGVFVEDLVLSALPRWESKDVYAFSMFVRIEDPLSDMQRNTEIHFDGSNPDIYDRDGTQPWSQDIKGAYINATFSPQLGTVIYENLEGQSPHAVPPGYMAVITGTPRGFLLGLTQEQKRERFRKVADIGRHGVRPTPHSGPYIKGPRLSIVVNFAKRGYL